MLRLFRWFFKPLTFKDTILQLAIVEKIVPRFCTNRICIERDKDCCYKKRLNICAQIKEV